MSNGRSQTSWKIICDWGDGGRVGKVEAQEAKNMCMELTGTEEKEMTLNLLHVYF